MPDTVRLNIKLTPRASRNEIKGWTEGSDGRRILRVSVTAVPEKGKANAVLIELLAEYLDLPKSAFTILRGGTDRNKIIEIQGLRERHKTILEL